MKNVIKIAVSFIVVLALIACGASTKEWQTDYDLGLKLLNEGKYEEAIIAFSKVIEIDDKVIEAYMYKAEAEKSLGRVDDAVKTYTDMFTVIKEKEITKVPVGLDEAYEWWYVYGGEDENSDIAQWYKGYKKDLIYENNGVKGDWATAYIDIVESHFAEYEHDIYDSSKVRLLYINDDDIPELYWRGLGGADGSILYTYDVASGTVDLVRFEWHGFRYVPYGNCVVSDGGRMDIYWDKINKIENGKFVEVHSGDYEITDWGDGINDDTTVGEYFWDDVKVSKEEYYSALKASYEEEMMVDIYPLNDDESGFMDVLLELSRCVNRKSGNYEISENELITLTDCAYRLGYILDDIGSADFARRFVYDYYLGKDEGNILEKQYEGYTERTSAWTVERIEADYKLLFGTDMPAIDYEMMGIENGVYYAWAGDEVEFGMGECYFKDMQEIGKDTCKLVFGVSTWDFGTDSTIYMTIKKANNENGFIITDLDVEYPDIYY